MGQIAIAMQTHLLISTVPLLWWGFVVYRRRHPTKNAAPAPGTGETKPSQ